MSRLFFTTGKGRPTGFARKERFSPAWAMADQIIALYRAKDGHKTIAKRLGISPRIAREILIACGEWKPRSATIGRKGQGDYLKNQLAAAMKRVEANCAYRLDGLATAMQAVVRRCVKANNPTTGMSNKDRFRWKYQNDPAFRLAQLTRRRMRKIIQCERIPSKRQIELQGCSPEEFRDHIQSQFVQGMGWHNNGTGRGKWHVDHIVPCRAFDQASEAQRRICWHFTNMRPIWSKANMRKSGKIDHRNAQLGLPL